MTLHLWQRLKGEMCNLEEIQGKEEGRRGRRRGVGKERKRLEGRQGMGSWESQPDSPSTLRVSGWRSRSEWVEKEQKNFWARGWKRQRAYTVAREADRKAAPVVF